MLTAEITPGGIFISMPWWANTEWENTEWANTRFAPTWHNIIQLIVNGQLLIVMQGYPNANFANGRESTQITAFVIPNVVRNLASNALGVRPWASGGEPTEQRAGRKKIRLSEAKRVT